MKILTLLLLLAGSVLAQSPVERFPWKDQQKTGEVQAPAQQYETYRQPWLHYRTEVESFKRSRNWQRCFIASSFAAVGSALVYSQSTANSPSATTTRVVSLGISGGLLAFEFLTNREGRRDKDYSLLNLGVGGSFAALTVRDQVAH